MPRIRLPRLTDTRGVDRPQRPADPPTDDDVAAAHHLCDRLMKAHRKNNSSARDLVHGLRYKSKLLSAVADPALDDGPEPPWFREAMDRLVLRPLNAAIRQEINNLRQEMRTGQGQMKRLGAIALNENRDAGHEAHLEVVPFLDGTDPTEPPHNLPPLTSRRAVRQLTPAQRNAYYRGYQLPPQIRGVQRRIAQILIAIGSSEV